MNRTFGIIVAISIAIIGCKSSGRITSKSSTPPIKKVRDTDSFVPYIGDTHLSVSRAPGQSNTPRDISQCVNVFANEIAGIGRGFAYEYERRLQKHFAGLGIRGGIGIAAGDITYTSFPVQFNYLVENWGGYFDLGAGATFIRNNDLKNNPEYEIGGMYAPNAARWTIYETYTISYRFSNIDTRGTMLRLGVTVYYGYGHMYLSPGVSIEGVW